MKWEIKTKSLRDKGDRPCQRETSFLFPLFRVRRCVYFTADKVVVVVFLPNISASELVLFMSDRRNPGTGGLGKAGEEFRYGEMG